MKPTTGSFAATGNGVHVRTRCVATTHMEPHEQRHADAVLIADAFNTYTTTGHAPSVLAAQLSEHKAARIAYASEFPQGADGEPDVGNIHANIRALKAERDALLAACKASADGIKGWQQMMHDAIANSTKGKT